MSHLNREHTEGANLAETHGRIKRAVPQPRSAAQADAYFGATTFNMDQGPGAGPIGPGPGCNLLPGIGNSFIGIEQADGPAATVDHYDFGIAGFNGDEVRPKLRARNLKFADGNSQESFKFRDPNGFQIQLNAPDYVGHVS